ncbi:hypothetical protein ACFFX0_02240 [Citricoccus parietis]|uniref:Uncharacterized protein n=1 Tax=Citricoccus parietis TaxID=592307 RepID=A0ABV5FTQ2_9MICC
MCQFTLIGRTFSTSSIQREVIQANGQTESNQKSTVWVPPSVAVFVASAVSVMVPPGMRMGDSGMVRGEALVGLRPTWCAACAAPHGRSAWARSPRGPRHR